MIAELDRELRTLRLDKVRAAKATQAMLADSLESADKRLRSGMAEKLDVMTQKVSELEALVETKDQMLGRLVGKEAMVGKLESRLEATTDKVAELERKRAQGAAGGQARGGATVERREEGVAGEPGLRTRQQDHADRGPAGWEGARAPLSPGPTVRQ